MEDTMPLSRDHEREARERADVSEFSFYMTLVALLLVAAFSAYMVFTHG
jgi:hypothetical protein